MKVEPVATNHILLHLDNGEILDINDGTAAPKGDLTVRLTDPTYKRMVIVGSITYDATVRLMFDQR